MTLKRFSAIALAGSAIALTSAAAAPAQETPPTVGSASSPEGLTRTPTTVTSASSPEGITPSPSIALAGPPKAPPRLPHAVAPAAPSEVALRPPPAVSLTSLPEGPARPEPSLPSESSPEAATPLGLRPSKPLELASEPAHPGIGWKIAAIALVLGGVGFYSRRKFASKRTDDAQLTIVRRATIGFRSELLVVNVEGQRLLLGVTPQSIQSLALLDSDDTAPAFAASPSPDVSSSLGDRFAAILDAADSPRAKSPRREPTAKRALSDPAASSEEEPDFGSQARGLLALRRPR